MAGGNFTITQHVAGEVITAAENNADRQDIVDHLMPIYLDDYSADLATMRLQTSPGGVGTESFATSLGGELARLRYALARAQNTTYWYQQPQTVGYNVKAYGALGDGVTNDTTAINALMTTVGAAGGGAVYFPAGTYLLGSRILIPSNTMVFGDGPSTIIKMGAAQTDCALVNSGFPTSATNVNIVIKDLAINCNRLTPAGSFISYDGSIWNNSTAYALNTYVANSTAGFRIYKVITAGTTSGAGTGPTSTSADITDGTCHFQYVEDLWTSTSDPTGHQAGIEMSRVTNVHVDNVYCYMSRDNGVIFELCYGAKISNCHFSDINKNSVYFSDNEHSVCLNNHTQYSYAGFAFANEWHSTMIGNVGFSCLNYFISAGRDCWYCDFVGNDGGTSNSASNGQSSGGDFLVVAESITGTVHGKTYALPYDDYRYGMNHCVIANNNLTRIQTQFSDNNLIIGNKIHDARRDGIHLIGSSQNIVAYNSVYNGGSTTIGPWAFGNLQGSGGALQVNIQSVQNRFLYNQVHDDRDNDGTVRWGFTFTGASVVGIHLIGNMVYLDNSVTIAARFYNWNVDYGVFQDNYYNGLNKFVPTGIPTAREELRGDVWTANGGAGATDKHYICRKNAADTYEFDILPSMFRCVGTGTTTWDMTDTADAATNSATITVTGAATTDFVLVTYDSIVAAGNFLLSGYVQAANTVRIVVMNKTGGNYNPVSGTATAIVLRLT